MDFYVDLKVWDTVIFIQAGQEQFRSITKSYYRGSAGAIIVYDITSRISFDNIKKWIGYLLEETEGGIAIMILGNKSDLDAK